MWCAGICATPPISGSEGQAMLSLAEYRKKPKMLADFLPWAALVAPGVVLNKDGSFQRTARFRGPDLDSATPAELVATTVRVNNALRRLGSGWAIFVEASRHAAQRYPHSELPDPPLSSARRAGHPRGDLALRRPCSRRKCQRPAKSRRLHRPHRAHPAAG